MIKVHKILKPGDVLKVELLTQSYDTRTLSSLQLIGGGCKTTKKFSMRQVMRCAGRPWELLPAAGSERDRKNLREKGPLVDAGG